MKLDTMKTFDVYNGDADLLQFMRTKVKANNFVLGASHDEASFKLTSGTRKAFRTSGITILEKADFRDSYVFLGQHGLTPGEAAQQIETRKDSEGFALVAEISGCIDNPMGKLVDRSQQDKKIEPPRSISTEAKDCGVPKPCDAGSFSVRLYTGIGNKDGIKICYDGKYIMSRDLNDGGRGLNFVVVDPTTKEVLHVSRFDTFAADSSTVEMFLEMINDDAIIMVVAHDEASQKLDGPVRDALEAIGSSYVKLIGFRDVWTFVGQKGMQGFSPYEEFQHSESDKDHGVLLWPKPIDYITCIPQKIEGLKEKKVILRNDARREFCRRYDGHAEFCDEDHVDTPIPSAANETNPILKDHEIFNTPIVVMPGLNHHAARQQLEGLLLNPGIKPEMITVYFDEKFDEAGALAKLFGVSSASLDSSVKYSHLVGKAMEKFYATYPKARYVIVLEEEVIPTPDFLNYLGQCMAALDADKSLVGASSWNNNGYKDVSDDSKVAFRAEGFPGFGFLLRVSFYDENMKGNMRKCCGRAWEGWFKEKKIEMIIPGTSRVIRGHYDGRTTDVLKELFNRPRQYVGKELIKLSNANALTGDKYTAAIHKILSSAKPYPDADLKKCIASDKQSYAFPDLETKEYAIYYKDSADEKLLSRLCKCFTLFQVVGEKSKDRYKGMMRFSRKGSTVFIIESQSEFAKHKPSGSEFLSLTDIEKSKTR